MKNLRMIMVESLNKTKANKLVMTGAMNAAMKRIVNVTGTDLIIDSFISGVLYGPLQSNKPITINAVITKIRDNISSEYLFKLIENGIGGFELKYFERLIGRQNDFCNQMIGKKRIDGFTPNARHNLIRLLMGIDGKNISNSPKLRSILSKNNKKNLIHATKKDTGVLRYFIQATIDKFNEEAKYFEYVKTAKSKDSTIYVKRIDVVRSYESYMLKEPGQVYDMRLALNVHGPKTLVSAGIDAIVNMPFTLDNEFNSIVLEIIDKPIFEQIMRGDSLDENSIKAKTSQARHYIKEGVQFWEEIGRSKFYSNYVVDFRGRITQLGGISSCAAKPCKALLRSGIAAPLGKSGYKHILNGIASAMGKDKETFFTREKYARSNLIDFYEIGEKISTDPVGQFAKLIELGADDPFQAASLCLELYRCSKDTEYQPNVFIGFDATCSAVQLVGLLMGNKTLTEASNIRCGEETEDKIYDSYMLLANLMDQAAPKFRTEENKDIVDMWLAFDAKTKRAFAKPLLMTRLYGSRFSTWRDRSRETAIEKGIIAPKDKELVRRFGIVIAQLFQFTFDNEDGFNCLRSYEDFAKQIAKAYASKGMPTIWTLQDGTQYYGQKVVSKYKRFSGDRYISYIAGKKLETRTYGLDMLTDIEESLTLKEIRELNKPKLTSAIAPNYIHSHDALLLYNVVLKMNTTLRLTHDCFGVVPGLADSLLKALDEACVELFGDNKLRQLEAWRDECYVLTGIEIDMPNNYLEAGIPADEIRKAKYKFS